MFWGAGKQLIPFAPVDLPVNPLRLAVGFGAVMKAIFEAGRFTSEAAVFGFCDPLADPSVTHTEESCCHSGRDPFLNGQTDHSKDFFQAFTFA
jgi:hypothetical protein